MPPITTRRSTLNNFVSHAFSFSSGGGDDPDLSTTIPHILIIGGGYAGCLLGSALEQEVRQGKCRLTLIERRPTFHHKIASIRASVRGGHFIDRTQIPLTDILKYAKIVQSNVRKVNAENDTVELEDGTVLRYDILVCATGILSHSSGDLPASVRSPEQVRDYFNASAEAIKSHTRHITIVGGGPSAIEYAGEIRAAYPDKKITMICSSGHLLSSCVAAPSGSFMRRLHKKLQNLGIVVIKGEKVVSPSPEDFYDNEKFITGPVVVKTQGAKNLELETDLVIWCAPWKVNSSLYSEEWLNASAELQVDDTFRVKGCDKGNVFAFGDISSIAETKQAITLPEKVPLIKSNILQVVADIAQDIPAQLTPLKRYNWTDRTVMYLPIGPKKGVSQVGRWVYDDKKTAKFKGMDLYTDHFWKLLTGKPAPPQPPLFPSA